ncbi:MAG: hypothetical protein LBI05_01480, partial [Planctomycetaceae bacterium]|nr:hypothetical protein [Planctomycetaceae bacterium]
GGAKRNSLTHKDLRQFSSDIRRVVLCFLVVALLLAINQYANAQTFTLQDVRGDILLYHHGIHLPNNPSPEQARAINICCQRIPDINLTVNQKAVRIFPNLLAD